MNNWIERNGNECPVAKGTIVDVKHRDGNVYEKQEAGVRADPPNGYAEDWDFDGVSGDIVAYRLHQESASLTTQLRTATAKRDKQAAKAARHTEKLQHREAEVERLKSELERHIEAETGLVCTIGEKVDGIPDGVDVDDPKTWREGDIVKAVTSSVGYIISGNEYIADGCDRSGDVIIKCDEDGDQHSPARSQASFRFVRRPA